MSRVEAVLPFSRPFVVAHRAANLPGRLPDLPAGVVPEADVHLYRERVEVRHAKSAWPLPVLWDGRRVELARRPRLELGSVLDALAPGRELMLDLKGPWLRLGELVREQIAPYLGTTSFTVCARRWSMLELFAGLPVRRVHSIGSEQRLRLLLRRGRPVEAVSVHERLLGPASAAALRRIAGQLLAWPVNDPSRARELLGLGARGLISDRPSLISGCLAGGTRA